MFEHPPDLSSDIDWMLQSGQVSLDILAETLVDTWFPLIFNFSYLILDDEDEARLVAIETFVTALLGTHHYSSELGVQKWLLRYAIRNLSSKIKPESASGSDPWVRRWLSNRLRKNPSNSSRIMAEPAKEENNITWQVLASSPLEEKLPALLYYQLNFKIEDVAEILNCEEHTVHFRLQKSRSRLRRELETSSLRNASIKTGYMERLMRRTYQQHRNVMPLQGNQRSIILGEIVRLSNRKQHIRRTHISVQEFGTISLVVLVIASISWGFSYLLPVPVSSAPRQSTRAPAAAQLASTAMPIPIDPQGQDNSEFPLQSLIHYIVQSGDTLEIVSARLGTTPDVIRSLNNLSQDDSLLAGQILVLQAVSTGEPYNSPVFVPDQSPKLLNVQSSPSLILERLQKHDQFYQSLWAEGQVVLYGPAGYSGPPRSYRVQLWSIPGSVFVIAGPLVGNPGGVLLSDEIPAVSSGRSYLALRSGDNKQWFYSDEEILNRKPVLERLAYPIEALELVQKMVQYQPRKTLFAPVRVETVLGRNVLVTDITSQDDEKRGRLWIDQSNGIILRWQHFTGLQENIVDWEVTLTNVVFDNVLHPSFFKPYSYLPETFAQDFRGLPENQTKAEAISLRSQSFTHPELSFPAAPESFDPGNQWLVFQYPNLFDYHTASSEVEIFSNQYYLGSLPFGNPWTLVCARAPDGYKIAYVDVPESAAQETFLNWFDLREPELKVHNVLGGTAIKELVFSPDSRYLAVYGSYGGVGGIYMVDFQTQRIRQLMQLPNARSLAWSPDGTSLALIARTEAAVGFELLLVINIEDGRVIYRSLWDSQDSGSLNKSPVMDWGVRFPVQPQGLEGCARPPVGNE